MIYKKGLPLAVINITLFIVLILVLSVEEILLILISSYSKAVNATHVVKWENGKVVKSEMS